MLGFHTAGEGDITPTPKRFQTKFISKCNTSQLQRRLGPQKPPEATPEVLNLHFLEEHIPRSPKEQYPFPFLTKLIP